MCDVYAYPLTTKILRGRKGRTTTTERVKDDITGIRRCLDDNIKQCERLLRRIAKSFRRRRREKIDTPNIWPKTSLRILVGCNLARSFFIRKLLPLAAEAS